MEEKIMRRFVIKLFYMNEVNFGLKIFIKKDVFIIDLLSIDEIKEREELIIDIKVDIIKFGDYDREINIIMDIILILIKVLGRLGEGIIYILMGVYVMLIGVDEDGN